MKRREAIRYLGLGFAGVTFTAVLPPFVGCEQKRNDPTVTGLVFLNQEQFGMVRRISDIILPETDSPGAGQAGVAAFIDVMLRDCYYEQDQQAFLQGLDRIKEDAERTGSAFRELDREQQTRLFRKEAEMKEGPSRFFVLMKELTLFGYFTSEVGATQALRYNPVPGKYEGCIPLSPGDKTWAIQS